MNVIANQRNKSHACINQTYLTLFLEPGRSSSRVGTEDTKIDKKNDYLGPQRTRKEGDRQ